MTEQNQVMLRPPARMRGLWHVSCKREALPRNKRRDRGPAHTAQQTMLRSRAHRPAARELDVKVRVRVVKVRDIDEARRINFHGSPSVLVAGVDVEGPEVAERSASFG